MGNLRKEFKPGTRYHADHVPSGETWVIIGISSDIIDAFAAGWPPTIGKIIDMANWEEAGELSEHEIEYRQKTFGGSWI